MTKTGQGARIEAISRGANAFLVPGKSFKLYDRVWLIDAGGSEDILLDLGVREALKLSFKAEKARL